MYTAKIGDCNLEIRAVDDGIFRVHMNTKKKLRKSLLEKYNLISEPEFNAEERITKKKNGITVKSGEYSLELNTDSLALAMMNGNKKLMLELPVLEDDAEGFALSIGIDDTERLYGLGDENRESLNKRGRTASLWCANVSTYGPVPYIMSSNGWGIFINSTYRTNYDLGKAEKNKIKIDASKGDLDFYLFMADDMLSVLEKYTRIVGKPMLLPQFAYGFTFVTNEESNARDVLNDCLGFRTRDIPCDVIGLEPGWMEKYYDFSTDKQWSRDRFWIPWTTTNLVKRENPAPPIAGNSSPQTFLASMRRMDFRLSLWLCMDYDLLWKEENDSFSVIKNSLEDAVDKDEHFAAAIYMDKITKPGEAWFEHLKKFVDNGAVAFKLDASNQVLEHPDRLWAGKYTDDEVHNAYPLIYAKQMKEGFEEHTGGRRAMIYTSVLYAGTQKYAATWAGDTGGGPKSMVSILNLAMCGHSNASCDMAQNNKEGIHFGFLAPWAQLASWRYWLEPWYLGSETEAMFRRYSKLRSSLFPYIYSMAHIANKTGIPLARPMCLIYPEDEKLTDAQNMYMLGDSLLVLAFDMNARLPEGRWYDLLGGGFVNGAEDFTYSIPEGFGGGLFARPGALFVTQKDKPCLFDCKPSVYTVHAVRGGEGEFTLVEDDGVTNKYAEGQTAVTRLAFKDMDSSLTLTVKRREGSFESEGAHEYDAANTPENDASHISPLMPVTGFDVVIYSEHQPASVKLNGEKIRFNCDGCKITFAISAEIHEKEDLTVCVEF